MSPSSFISPLLPHFNKWKRKLSKWRRKKEINRQQVIQGDQHATQDDQCTVGSNEETIEGDEETSESDKVVFDSKHLQQVIEGDPHLPPELEEDIFRQALSLTPKGKRISLLLVSKRIFDWFIPCYYETLVFHPGKPYRSKNVLLALSKYGPHVRNLYLDINASRDPIKIGFPLQIIKLCPNVTNLSCHANIVNTDSISHLPLRRLSLGYSRLAEIKDSLPLPISITHLDMQCIVPSTFTVLEQFKRLTAKLPNLTHVMFNPKTAYLGRWATESMLYAFPTVKVVICSLDGGLGYIAAPHCPESCRGTRETVTASRGPDLDFEMYKGPNNFRDIRLVFARYPSLLQDWVRGVNAEEDLWSAAEGIVKRRIRERTEM